MKKLFNRLGAPALFLVLCHFLFMQYSMYKVAEPHSIDAVNNVSPIAIGPMAVILDDEAFKDEETVTVEHPAYLAQMHTVYNIPVWVSHTLSDKKLRQADSLHLTRGDDAPNGYPKDPSYTALKGNLYNSTGYDHGHLAPAADFGYNKKYYDECFYMTNMAPQHGCMNQKGWCYLESQCRAWARENPKTIMYIVSGPVLKKYKDHTVFSDTLCIKKNMKVYVPAYFFKAVCMYDERTGTAQSVGFIVPNGDVGNEEIKAMNMSIDEVEKATGLDLFSALPDEVEQETETNMAELKYEAASDCGSGKACPSVYSRRTTPELRTKCRCSKTGG